MDAATLVTIITMFIVTDTSSEFIKYDGLMDCLMDDCVPQPRTSTPLTKVPSCLAIELSPSAADIMG